MIKFRADSLTGLGLALPAEAPAVLLEALRTNPLASARRNISSGSLAPRQAMASSPQTADPGEPRGSKLCSKGSAGDRAERCPDYSCRLRGPRCRRLPKNHIYLSWDGPVRGANRPH